jgi:hypothetical protein
LLLLLLWLLWLLWLWLLLLWLLLDWQRRRGDLALGPGREWLGGLLARWLLGLVLQWLLAMGLPWRGRGMVWPGTVVVGLLRRVAWDPGVVWPALRVSLRVVWLAWLVGLGTRGLGSLVLIWEVDAILLVQGPVLLGKLGDCCPRLNLLVFRLFFLGIIIFLYVFLDSFLLVRPWVGLGEGGETD